jgi:isopenicillin N synthase-like dioxygenase
MRYAASYSGVYNGGEGRGGSVGIVRAMLTSPDQTFEALEQFFALPEEEKLKVSWLNSIGTRGYESFAEVAEYEGSGKKNSSRSNVKQHFDRSRQASYGPTLTGRST